MYLEIALYDNFHTIGEIKQSICIAVDSNKINGISILPIYINKVKDFIPGDILLSTPIDFPGNNESIKNRQREVLTAARMGVSAIDFPVNTYFYVNKKYSKLAEELSTVQKICSEYNLTLRLFIDSSVMDIKTIVPILVQSGIDYVFPTIGSPLRSQIECLEAALDISEISDLRIILNPYFSRMTQTCFSESANIHGMRISSMYFHNFLDRL